MPSPCLPRVVVAGLAGDSGKTLVAAGLALGEGGLLRLDGVADAALLERLTEIAVIVSLFTAGLKLRLPLRDDRPRLEARAEVVVEDAEAPRDPGVLPEDDGRDDCPGVVARSAQQVRERRE